MNLTFFWIWREITTMKTNRDDENEPQQSSIKRNLEKLSSVLYLTAERRGGSIFLQRFRTLFCVSWYPRGVSPLQTICRNAFQLRAALRFMFCGWTSINNSKKLSVFLSTKPDNNQNRTKLGHSSSSVEIILLEWTSSLSHFTSKSLSLSKQLQLSTLAEIKDTI